MAVYASKYQRMVIAINLLGSSAKNKLIPNIDIIDVECGLKVFNTNQNID